MHAPHTQKKRHICRRVCAREYRGLHFYGSTYLSPAGLDHEVAGEGRGRGRLERADHLALVQRVARNKLGRAAR